MCDYFVGKKALYLMSQKQIRVIYNNYLERNQLNSLRIQRRLVLQKACIGIKNRFLR